MQVMKIFRFLFALLLTVILFACTDLSSYEKELEQIDNEADRLSALCDEINDKILTLESLAAQIGAREDITGVSQIQDENGVVTGYSITFRNSETISFPLVAEEQASNNGVSVKQDDTGMWWTFNGEYIVGDDGSRVPVGTGGATPQLKVEGTVWYVSIDGGVTWEQIEVAKDGSPSCALGITSVTENDDEVIIVFSDGTSFSVPKSKTATLSFTYNRNIVPGGTVTVKYRFSSSTGIADITAFGNKYLGAVSMNHRPQYSDGYIYLTISEDHDVSLQKLFVYMDYGEGTIVRVLTFDEYGTFEIDAVAPIPASGGEVIINVNSEGYPYLNTTVVQGSDWFKGSNGIYMADPNKETSARVAAIQFQPKTSALADPNFTRTVYVVQFGTGDFPCYEEYFGNWKMSGTDRKTGLQVSRSIEVKRDPEVSGGYLVYGLSPDAGTTCPVRMQYSQTTGSMEMKLPQLNINGSGVSVVPARFEGNAIVPSGSEMTYLFHSSASSNSISASMTAETSYVFVGEDGSPSARDDVFYYNVSFERQGLPSYYEEGDVVMLNEASAGYTPLNLVLLGDGYQQKDMRQGGKFERTARSAMGAFFAMEPYATFMDRFDVYMVANISKDEGTDITSSGVQKDTYYSSVCAGGGNTLVTCDYAKVQETVRKLGLTEENYSLYRTVVLVLVNTDEQSGTCWYIKGGKIDDSLVGDGIKSFAVATLAANTMGSSGLIRHEGGGHAFGRLADEYNWGNVADDAKRQNLLNEQNNNGFYFNVSAYADERSPWGRFIGLEGYEDVGYYEGAWGCVSGIYRPTENSVMLNNQGDFNAPSREIIYRRIILQSEGAGSYSFEKFLEYDRRNI